MLLKGWGGDDDANGFGRAEIDGSMRLAGRNVQGLTGVRGIFVPVFVAQGKGALENVKDLLRAGMDVKLGPAPRLEARERHGAQLCARRLAGDLLRGSANVQRQNRD